MARARVMLVDDDASIRRFVAMALEDLDVDLLPCASVAEAVSMLRERGPVDLLITDLMMPGENGLALLEGLSADPALRGSARLAVFSAGLNPDMRGQLSRFDIWRLLSKPISVVELESCVQEATQAPPPAAVRSVAGAARSAALGLLPREVEAANAHFGGDLPLFIDFRTGCLAQFSADVQRGDQALAQGNAQDLRHLAHSLKSVLALLGHDDLSNTGRQLEALAASADLGGAAPLWATLRQGLTRLSLG